MKCTTHTSRTLTATKTKYGLRWSCPVSGCTVVLWDGSTSTPADYQTRQKRIEAHDIFDKIWKSGMMMRQEAYRSLARHMGISDGDAVHIGESNIEQCEKIITFATMIIEAK